MADTFPARPQATAEFIERVARYLEDHGVARIGGRIYGYLLTQDGPRSLDHLVDALGASKGSVSLNVRSLAQEGLVERVTVPGDRKDYYSLPAGGATRPLELLLTRVEQLNELYAWGHANGEISSPEARNRLRLTTPFLAHVHQQTTQMLSEWRRRTRGMGT